MWQTFVYWLMGAMSNDLAKLAVFTGFCKSFRLLLSWNCNSTFTDKSLQSAGAAGAWHADAVKAP